MGISINGLRKLVGALAALFAIMLILGGLCSGTPVQESLSAYAWTPAHVIFEGFLITFGIILSVYMGYDLADRIVTAIASFFMFMIALFPMQGPEWYLFAFIPRAAVSVIHYVSAGFAFSLMGLMSIWNFRKSGGTETPQKTIRNRIYFWCGIVIFVAIAWMLIVQVIPAARENTGRLWFVIEALVPTAFGVSWYVKGGGLFSDK